MSHFQSLGSAEDGDEAHLLLGITELTLTAFLVFSGYVFRSQPNSLPENSGLPDIHCPTRAENEKLEAPDWFGEAYPALRESTLLTGYEICSALKASFKAKDLRTLSGMELLLAQNIPGVGRANHFLSHWQGETLSETLVAMRLFSSVDTFFVDYVGVRQCAKKDFQPATVHKVIGTVQSTVIVYAPSQYGSSFTRLWCIYEIICSVEREEPSDFIVQDIKCLKSWKFFAQRRRIKAFGDFVVRIQDADARRAEDKEMVLDFATKLVGIDVVNQRAQRAIAAHAKKLGHELRRNILVWIIRVGLLLTVMAAGSSCQTCSPFPQA